ncbi:MAG: tetratricopeptide repeat protein [Phycisphaerales bacterium]
MKRPTRTTAPRTARTLIPPLAMLGAGLFAVLAAGCASSNSGPYTTQSESRRDPMRAQRLTLEAVEIAPRNSARAEAMLRDALTADLYHGPAHNNLGVLLLKKDPPQLYEAASEFEWARKLMPGHPDPRVNLAIVLERAGRIDEALSTYAAALEVYPNYLPAMQALARLQIRSGRADLGTDAYLNEIALRGESTPWREWARAQLIKRGDARTIGESVSP